MARLTAGLVTATLFVCVSLMVGCVQYPTERQSVVDQRPQISFLINAADAARIGDARVLVDGLDSGRVSDFREGIGALRVLPGSHNIRIVLGGVVLLDERTYLGDGVARPFIVK